MMSVVGRCQFAIIRVMFGRILAVGIVVISITSGMTAADAQQTQEQARIVLEDFLKPLPATETTHTTRGRKTITVTAVEPFGGWSSRDGKKFASLDKPIQSSIDPYAIFIQNSDGSGKQEPKMNMHLVNPLDFSPDGKHLLLVGVKGPYISAPILLSAAAEQLWQLSLTDESVTALTPPNLFVLDGQYSPDGKQIAFTAVKFQPDTLSGAIYSSDALINTANLYLVNSDGSGIRQLHRGSAAACWSPSGHQIAFLYDSQGTKPDYQEVWIIDVRTGKPHRELRFSGLSRLTHTREHFPDKMLAKYTFHKLAWLNEKELLAEAIWGGEAATSYGTVRIGPQGNIEARLPNFQLVPLSESAFHFVFHDPTDHTDKTYNFLARIVK